MNVKELFTYVVVVATAAVAGSTGGWIVAEVQRDEPMTVEANALQPEPDEVTVAPESVDAPGAANGPDSAVLTEASDAVVVPLDESPLTAPGALQPDPPSDLGAGVVAEADARASDAAVVQAFVADFDAAHAAGDVETLLDTLHPAMAENYGREQCRTYIKSTVGTIADIDIGSLGSPEPFQMPSDGGGIDFDLTYPVDAEWTIVASGERVPVAFHLVPTADGLSWLTTCGR